MRKLFVSFLLFSSIVAAQTQDFNYWSKISIETKLINGIDVEIEEQLRFDNNAANLYQYFTEFTIC